MKKTLRLIALACAVLAVFTFAKKPETVINVIPYPQSVEVGKGFFKGAGANFNCDQSIDAECVRLIRDFADKITYVTGRVNSFAIPVGLAKTAQTGEMKGFIFLKDNAMGPEEYSIDITKKTCVVKASAYNGFLYAIQTLKQLTDVSIFSDKVDPAQKFMFPVVSIKDKPRFAYRGMHLDCARHFFSVEEVKKYLDIMATYKLNRMHWHLTEDQGWRIEIKKYPKLTQVGAWRGRNEALDPAYNSGEERFGGFYTQEDIREIVAYAADRNIEIIPEIDLPGHSKALAVSYPEILCRHNEELLSVQGETRNVICVGRENTYKMLDNIIKEIAQLFPSKYIHIGVEEVVTESWKYCPDCQELMKEKGYTEERQLLGYFGERMEKILAKYGKKVEAWEDVVEAKTISRDNLVLVWHDQKVLQKALDAGYPAVTQNCYYLYMDMKYTPAERGHTWASIIDVEKVYSFDPLQGLDLSGDKQKLVRGLQGGLWTELLFYPPHFSEYQLFPRMCAVAEVGWTPQELRNYADFDARLARTHFERMWNMGIRFRIPAPDVDAQGNVRCPYPNMVVRYTFDGTEPTVSSPVVTGRIVTDHPENLRFATFYADVKSITVEVPGTRMYLKPAVKVSSSMETVKRQPVENLALYEKSKSMRTANPPKEGDYVLFTFEEPVSCRTITVQTNDPVNNFFGITQGFVEVLYEGDSQFTPSDRFNMLNRVVLRPDRPVKAVKIVITGPCEGKAVSIQPLIIE